MGLRMTERPDDIRERILQAGIRAWNESGYFGVSMRGIAREVGVHPRTIGHHFGGKPGLLSAIEAGRSR
jgi:AcrR family transcriptional regulator